MIVDSSAALAQELDELLEEPVSQAQERARTTFDAQTAETGKKVVLFGTGNVGRRLLESLRADGVEPLAFSDNNSAKWGSKVDELAVLSPGDAVQRYGQEATFVVTVYNPRHSFPDTRRQLETLGAHHVTSVLAPRWKYHEAFLPYYRDDLPHKVLQQRDAIREAFALWSDDYSRREFVAQVRWRLHADFDALAAPSLHDQYFPADLITLSEDEFFVDAGAFDGDTIRVFLREQPFFRRILALEPDPANFGKLGDYIASLAPEAARKIDARQLAVGAANTELRFNAAGYDGSAVSAEGAIRVKCVKLDDLLAETKPTYIKLDIEGAELDALDGGASVISAARPRLAVCAYHVQDHLWKVPLRLAQLVPGARLHLRSHLYECWETVCYALPSDPQ